MTLRLHSDRLGEGEAEAQHPQWWRVNISAFIGKLSQSPEFSQLPWDLLEVAFLPVFSIICLHGRVKSINQVTFPVSCGV